MNKRQKEVQQEFLNNEKAVLKKLEAHYEDALDEINSKIELLLARQDADMQHVIYQVEYQKALKTQVKAILEQLQTNEFETVSEYLSKAYEDGFLGTMYDLQGQGIPLVFPIDQRQVVAAVQHETKLSQNLYTALGKDITDLQKKIAGEITRGIAGGQMYSEIARNVSNWARIPRNNAMRIARTEAHRIQSKATADAQFKAKEKGADVVKQWDSSLDKRTRKSHRELDGQIQELEEPFEINGHKAMHPGGFGVAKEDINCRCAILQRARWNLGSDYTKWSADAPIVIDDDGTTQFTIIEAKNYESFKKQYTQATERVREGVQKMKGKQVENVATINERATDSLLNAYDDRRKAFGLNLTSADELRKGSINPVTVSYTGVSMETAQAFDTTIRGLSEEYLTGFTKIEVGDKKRLFGAKTFATTHHNNLVGQKTLELNPHKTSDYSSLVERVRELSDRGYAVRIAEGMEGRYIATHEFAHSLIDLSGDYKNYIGMDVKKMKGIKKEIDSIFDAYKKEVDILESAYKAKERAFLDASISLDMDMDELAKLQKEALKAKEAYDAVRISKYSMESADEFMAEAFTQAKIGVAQGEYSQRVMEVLDKHFRKEPLENIGKSSTIELEDILIQKSVGAKTRNYDVLDPSTGEIFHFAEGTKIQNAQVFAGSGTKKSLHEGVAEGLSEQLGGSPEKWQHCKGDGVLDYHGEERAAEVHWFQEETVGKAKFKVKEWKDEG